MHPKSLSGAGLINRFANNNSKVFSGFLKFLNFDVRDEYRRQMGPVR
jgi:hypothetical protein